MATSNCGKTNANQQVVNINLNGLNLEKFVAKPEEKSKKKRRGGLALELKRAAKYHQSAKDNAEKRGVLASPPDHLLDATTIPQITWQTVQQRSDNCLHHRTSGSVILAQLSSVP